MRYSAYAVHIEKMLGPCSSEKVEGTGGDGGSSVKVRPGQCYARQKEVGSLLYLAKAPA